MLCPNLAWHLILLGCCVQDIGPFLGIGFYFPFKKADMDMIR
jgi:hypothetical protein